MRTLVARLAVVCAFAALALARDDTATNPSANSEVASTQPAADVEEKPLGQANAPVSFAGVTLPTTSVAWWRKSVTPSPDGAELAAAYVETADGQAIASIFLYRPAEAFDAHVDLLKADVLRLYNATLESDDAATLTFADGPHAGRVVRFRYATAFAQVGGVGTKVRSTLIAVPLDAGLFIARVTWPEQESAGATATDDLLKTIAVPRSTRETERAK